MLHKDVRYERRKLSNGIPVYFALSPHATNLRASINFSVGSAHEWSEIAGAAHALEHIFFTGTETRTMKELKRTSRYWHGHINASTGQTRTQFMASNNQFSYDNYARERNEIAENHARLMIDHLTDQIIGSTFPEEHVLKELKRVTNEIGRDHDGEKFWGSYVSPNFVKQPFNRSIAGLKSEARKLTRSDLLDFRERYYCRENASIWITGPVLDMDGLCEHMDTKFFFMRSGVPAPKLVPQLQHGDIRLLHAHREQNMAHVLLRQADHLNIATEASQIVAHCVINAKISEIMSNVSGSSYDYGCWDGSWGNNATLAILSANPDPDETRECILQYLKFVSTIADEISEDDLMPLRSFFGNDQTQNVPKDAEKIYNMALKAYTTTGDFSDAYQFGDFYSSFSHLDIAPSLDGYASDPIGTSCLGPKPDEMPTLAEIRELVGASPLPVAVPVPAKPPAPI